MATRAAPLLIALLLGGGCQEDPLPPPAPGTDGGSVTRPPIGSHRDGGATDGATDDGAATDAGTGPDCVEVPAGDLDNRAALVLDGAEQPFTVTRGFATWNAASCADPTILVVLTDGSCTVGAGERLVFFLRRDDIGTLLRTGPNLLGPELADALHVRYVKPPAAGELADQTWGDCVGASGDVTFTELDSADGARLTATFDLSLTDCDDPAVDGVLVARGAFNLTLGPDLTVVCP